MKKKIIITLFFLLYFIPINSTAEIKSIFEGNMEAKIKIILFESLTCSHCANFHKDVYPSLKDEFIDKGLIHIEYRNFPLDLAALNASKIAHCKNDGNSEILHYLFDNQKQWVRGSTIEEFNENIKNVIEKSKFNLDFNECINNKKVEDHILEDRIEGTIKFKIKATPTLIINDKKFEKPLNYEKLKKYLEKLI
tara:strand:- start:2354 stop:2935 length:582 start_codon:yes stop_codon:yes gene_type:complete